jgi:GntR family transcriptional repressor for pyruvate dehydrogenase complex
VAEALEELIVGGRLAAGAPLPPEAVLAARFHVSRVSLREAIRMLAARGLIEVRHGVGLFVAGASPRPVSDAITLLLRRERAAPEDLLEVRRLLEVEIAALAAQRATGEDLARLAEALAELGRTDQPLEAQIAADAAFHLALASAAHNPVFLAISEAVRQPLLESMRVTYPADDGPSHRQREHAAIFDAVRRHRLEDARTAMRCMLDVSAEAMRRHRAAAATAAAAGAPTRRRSPARSARSADRPAGQ